jgi:hypothetical protein
VITSGLYTWSRPFGARIVASMNTPSLSPFSQVHPSPSTHGVARPLALSGFFGTDTVQFVESAAWAVVWLKLNAAPDASTASAPATPACPAGLMGGMPATVGPVAAGEADPDGQGEAEAEAAGAEAAGAGALALAAGTGALALGDAAGALALAVDAEALALALPLAARALALPAGAGALALVAGADWLPLATGAGLLALAAAEAHEPRADCSMAVFLPPPETARTIPRIRPRATGMAIGTARRAARLFPRRRRAGWCPLSI